MEQNTMVNLITERNKCADFIGIPHLQLCKPFVNSSTMRGTVSEEPALLQRVRDAKRCYPPERRTWRSILGCCSESAASIKTSARINQYPWM